MIRRLLSLSIAILLLIAVLPSLVFAAPPASSMFVRILPTSGPRVLQANRTITFRLVVGGITMDPQNIGKRPLKGHGHIQVYLDRIPSDAYRKPDSVFLSSVAALTFSIQPASRLVRSLAKGSRHRLLVALAQNNYLLYRGIKPASFTVTVK